jgi:hypothetical protein
MRVTSTVRRLAASATLVAMVGACGGGHTTKSVSVTLTTPEIISAWIRRPHPEVKAKARETCRAQKADHVTVHVVSQALGSGADFEFDCKGL